MRRQRSVRRSLFAVVAVLASTLVVDQAAGLPRFSNDCSDDTITWHFSNDGDDNWTNTQKTWVRDALDVIEDELLYTGSRAVILTETSSSGVALEKRDLSGAIGSAGCNPFDAHIYFDTASMMDKGHWQKTARHEMQHLAGQHHSGYDDARDGRAATSSTCWTTAQLTAFSQGSYPDSLNMDQDSAIYLNYEHEDALANRQLSANIGFERGRKYWGIKNGNVTELNTGGATGPGHIEFQAVFSEYTSYMFQTARIWTGDGGLGRYRGKSNFKRPAGSEFFRITTRLYAKKLEDGTISNGCSYPRNLTNPNAETVVGGWIKLSDSGWSSPLGTTWKSQTSPWGYPSNISSLSDADGLQVQVRFYGRAKDNNVSVPFKMDNIRAERRN